ncbi:cytochrome P450 [Microlunatus elymi]|uniref:Cytochrome P450 n=2 Tax=Microlunatus elymi TaxID=2596828 RepID=A0A516Q5B0_9ACTN|nr:cytochrome P450 [Microlunatus elymi]
MPIKKQELQFIKELYGTKARLLWSGYLRRDPVARLQLEPGRLDPYPLYEQIRSRGRVSRTPFGHFVTVDHEICNEVLRSRDFGVGEDARDKSLSLLDLNPPDHTRLRRLVAPDFSVRTIGRYTPRIEAVLQNLIKDVPRDDPFDLVSVVAAPLPIAVIADLLGIPDADADEFARHGTEFGSALGGIQSLAHAQRLAATRKRLAEIFAGIFELRRKEPTDDVVSRIVNSDGTVRPEEMVPLCTLLLIAGFETTVNLIGNTVLALLSNPDQWRMLVEQPELAERAIEEGLRYDSPVQRTGRLATADTEVAGVPFKQGDWIMTAIGGANRDPAVFTDPARYDLHRDNAEDHLSFSGGVHYCLGAALARLEAGIALRTIVTEFPELALAGPRERRPGSLIRGMQHFPVRAPRSAVMV